jgi:hypothetical protein
MKRVKKTKKRKTVKRKSVKQPTENIIGVLELDFTPEFKQGMQAPTIDPEYAARIFGQGIADFIAEIQKQKKEYDAKRKSNK